MECHWGSVGAGEVLGWVGALVAARRALSFTLPKLVGSSLAGGHKGPHLTSAPPPPLRDDVPSQSVFQIPTPESPTQGDASVPTPTGRAASFSLVSARPAAGCSYVAPVASFTNSFYNALDQRCPWTWLQDRQVVAVRLAGKPLPI